ncbi:fatty acyl-CoA reductase 1-like [Watersipora subatra]|uniref:fatty acyl-CoA reductase 1-like n=1 Tax=Watersipora subatra TaxID=2589382 RepID=UPI00355B0A1F
MSLIQQFLAGRSLVVTGFSGFIGKLLVCKILTSSDVERIFVVMRKNTYSTVQDRLAHILENKVFSKLKEVNGEFEEKITAVEGDILETDLGLSPSDKELLLSNSSVIIHLAQISNCDAHLKDALEVNVHGTRNVLTFARSMSKLVSVVHLSSIYANSSQTSIGEIIYQPALQPNKLLGASEWVSDEIFRDMEAYLLQGYANSFTYSKSLCEYLIQQSFSDLPISIVRPAIIGSTWREPFQDWIDSPNGLVPIVKASGRGYLRVLKGRAKSTAELIPADTVVNTLLAVAWHQHASKSSTGSTSPLQIYNLTSNASRRLTWQSLEQIVCRSFRKNPFDSVIRIPQASMTNNRLVYTLKNGLFHIFPAYGADFINLLLGRSPHYVNTMRQFLKLLASVQYFTCRDWKIENSNIKELMSKLNAADKKVFGLDTSCTHWPTYIEGLCMGVKKYVLNESLSNLPAARTSLNRIWWSDRFWEFVLFLLFIRLASTKLEWAKKTWSMILALSMFIYGKIPKFAKAV